MSLDAPAVRRTLHKTFRSLGVPSYRLLWMGFMGTWFALQMQLVARGYLAYELTHSALALGEVALAIGLPRIVLSPLGGVMADRYPKKLVLIWSQVFQMFIALATADLVWSHQITIGWLIGLGVLQGAGFALNVPVRKALIPEMAGAEENVANAVVLNNTGVNLTRLVGPALAGILIEVPAVGLTGTFFACALCFVWGWVTAVLLPTPRAPVTDRLSMSEQVTAGFRYVFGSPALLALMGLGFVPLAIGYPYLQLMPVFALHVLHTGAAGLGALLTMAGIGGVFGTLATAFMADRRDLASVQLRVGVVFGIALVAFAVCSRLDFQPGAFAALLVTGFAGDSYMALNSTLVMLHTERAMYGRVMGTYMILQSVRQISVLPIGAVADAVGAPVTVGVAGLITALFIGGVRAWYPRYRQIV